MTSFLLENYQNFSQEFKDYNLCKPRIFVFTGAFPLSDTSLMTNAERNQFLPVVRTFTNVLEKGNADPNEINQLVQETRELSNLIPGNIGNSISGLIGNNNFGQQGRFSG